MSGTTIDTGRPVDAIVGTIHERGYSGSEKVMIERFADLAPSDLLAAAWVELSATRKRLQDEADRLNDLDWLLIVLADRAEKGAHRRAMKLYDPEFTYGPEEL